MFRKMKWKGLLVLLWCLAFCSAQRHRRRDFRGRDHSSDNRDESHQSFSPSRQDRRQDSSREQFGDFRNARDDGGDYGSSRERFSRDGDDYDYGDDSYNPSSRNSRSGRGNSFDNSRGRNDNQIPDYDYGERQPNPRQNHRQRPQNVRNTGYNNGRGRASGGEARHDDFADYSLGSSFDLPEGRQGAVPHHRPRGPPPGRPQGNGPAQRRPPPDNSFGSFDTFGQGKEDQYPQAQFGRQGRAFVDSGPNFSNEPNGPRGGFGNEEFHHPPPSVNNAGPDFRYRQSDQYSRPPFHGPRRPVVERGPPPSGGFGQPHVREFLASTDNEITPSMLAELEQIGLGNLAAPAPSASRPAPRPAHRAAPAPRPAPIKQIRYAVAGVEARQGALSAVLESDGRSAKINSKVKAVSTETNDTTADSETTDQIETQPGPEKGGNNIKVFNATEVLGAAQISGNSNATTDSSVIANATAQPFLLTTTSLPVPTNSTGAQGVWTTTEEPGLDEMTTIPVTMPPNSGKKSGYKKRSNVLLSNVAKRKVSPEYKYLKAFHSVFRGYVKKGGREACSMCSIEYCLNTCSHVLKPTCAGVDYNFESKTCTVHAPEDACSTLLPEGRTTHYIHIPCDKPEDDAEPLVVSKADEVAMLKTTPSPTTDEAQGEVDEDEDVKYVAKSPQGALQENVSPGGTTEPKQEVQETSDSKGNDFTFSDAQN